MKQWEMSDKGWIKVLKKDLIILVFNEVCCHHQLHALSIHPAVTIWVAIRPLPSGSKKSSFAHVTIDKIVFNGAIWVWSICLFVAIVPVERKTDSGPIMDDSLAVINSLGPWTQIRYWYMFHFPLFLHSINAFIIYYESWKNSLLRRRVRI